MLEGADILKNNENALYAFKLMNRAILTQHLRSKQDTRDFKNTKDDQGLDVYSLLEDYIDIDIEDRETWPKKIDYIPSWYPYQLAFILINIKSIVDPLSDARDNVECLWFPTGGGKTEAYLGLIAFSILYRRLLNPESRGVIAVMRYTLRLLTAQQFQRASCLITACDRIRSQMQDKLGTEPITIGLWVGPMTPNWIADGLANFDDLRSKPFTINKLLINKCPHCAASMGPSKILNIDNNKESMVVVGYKDKRDPGSPKKKIRYICENNYCEYGSQGS